jgi:hypothetical protein
MLKGVAGLVVVLVVAVSTREAPTQEAPAQGTFAQGAPRQDLPRLPRQDSPPLPPRQDMTHQDMTHQDMSHRDVGRHRLSQADLNALTDARISMAKVMLQMTPEQARFWPSIEEAIRNSAEAGYRRIAQMRAMADGAGEHEPDPIAVMRSRGEALAERGANLKKLADAWQPLYQTLNPEQKDRLRLVTAYVLRDGHRAMGRWAERGEAEGED